ncbi:unnamed protein product, partial [Rotaria socialis]
MTSGDEDIGGDDDYG